MPRRSLYEDEYNYDEDDENTKRGPRRFKKEDPSEKKKWDREEQFDRDHDYDERR